MNKRLTALLLALALILSVGMVSALADEETQTPEENVAAAAEAESTDAAAEDTVSGGEADASSGEDAPVVEVEEAAVNMVMFADLADLMRKNSPSYKALASQIDYIEEAKDSADDLEEMLAPLERMLATQKRNLKSLKSAVPAADELPAYLETVYQLENTIAELEEQTDGLRAGISGMSAMSAQNTYQMEAGCDQMIMGCETLYINLVKLKTQETALVRQIASLERTLKELKVRQDWGQVSALQVMELENGMETATNGLATLRMNVTNLKMQLEQMLGEEVTGTVAVGTLPRVTVEQLEAIDFEKDLQHVLRRNPDVQAAQDADDAMWSMERGGMSDDMWDSLSAANTYALEGAKLQAEVGFRTVYAKLQDARVAVDTAQSALKVEQLSYDAAALKYQQGTISHNALLTAEDELQTAKEAVVTAENDLFAAYNQYNWAVKRGILS